LPRIRRVGKSRTVSFHFESPFRFAALSSATGIYLPSVNSRNCPIFKPSSGHGPIVCGVNSRPYGRASQESAGLRGCGFADCDIQYASFAKAFHDRDVLRPVLKSVPSLGRRSRRSFPTRQSPRRDRAIDNGAICLGNAEARMREPVGEFAVVGQQYEAFDSASSWPTG